MGAVSSLYWYKLLDRLALCVCAPLFVTRPFSDIPCWFSSSRRCSRPPRVPWPPASGWCSWPGGWAGKTLLAACPSLPVVWKKGGGGLGGKRGAPTVRKRENTDSFQFNTYKKLKLSPPTSQMLIYFRLWFSKHFGRQWATTWGGFIFIQGLNRKEGIGTFLINVKGFPTLTQTEVYWSFRAALCVSDLKQGQVSVVEVIVIHPVSVVDVHAGNFGISITYTETQRQILEIKESRKNM